MAPEQQKKMMRFKVNLPFFNHVRPMARELFAKNLATTLRAGIPIVEALRIIEETTESAALRTIVADAARSMQTGNSLAKALGRYPKVFPRLFLGIITSGETAGMLPENLEMIADQLAKEREFLSKVRAAMIYPVIVFAAALIMGIAVSTLVLPKITPLLLSLQVELPLPTRVLIGVSEFIQAHGYILLPALALSIVAAVLAARNTAAQPLVHWLYLRLPFIRSLVQDANIAQFTRTFGTLLRSGVHIDEAARVTRDTLGNYYYRRALESVRTSIEKGGTLSKNLELYPALFPPLVSRLIRVGETTGKTADTLLYLNRHFESKMDVSLKTLTTALEPALLLVIGSVVAFVALAILTPIFELTSTIGNQ